MSDFFPEMLAQAKNAIKHAYAPYSDFPVACAIRSESNTIYAGVNVENVAFPLGCCAEQSAISAMVTSGERDIKEVLILGSKNDFCRPCGGCRQLLKEFADNDCIVTVVTAHGNTEQHTIGRLLPGAFDADLTHDTSESVTAKDTAV